MESLKDAVSTVRGSASPQSIRSTYSDSASGCLSALFTTPTRRSSSDTSTARAASAAAFLPPPLGGASTAAAVFGPPAAALLRRLHCRRVAVGCCLGGRCRHPPAAVCHGPCQRKCDRHKQSVIQGLQVQISSLYEGNEQVREGKLQ